MERRSLAARSLAALAVLASSLLAAAEPLPPGGGVSPPAAGGARAGAVEPGEVLWRGRPDAILRGAGERPFDLSPGGRSFVYLQGAPWPRVMLQPIPAPGAEKPEPVVLGTMPPYGTRAPRFDGEGRFVYYTADLGGGAAVAPSPPSVRLLPSRLPVRSRSGALRLGLVRAAVRGLTEEILLPAPGAKAGECAVFLDIHPGGRTVLVGIGVSSAGAPGDLTLELNELTFGDAGKPLVPPRSLSYSVSAQAAVRYSWDGTMIWWLDAAAGPNGQGPGRVFRYERASGLLTPAALDPESFGKLAGDVEVSVHFLPHPGSFGWDGFPLFLLSRGTDGPAVPLSMPEALASPLPLEPVAVRGDRILLAGGPEDRLETALARWDPAAFGRAIAAAPAATWPAADRAALLPGFSADDIRAQAADARAADLLRRISSSLILLPGAPVRAARARWAQKMGSADAVRQRQVEAIELVAGAFKIERSQPADGAEEAPAREVITYNGSEAWVADEGGRTASIPRAALVQEGGQASPLRLLLDPAGLGLPYMTVHHAGEAVEAEPGEPQPVKPAPAGADAKPADRRFEKLDLRSVDGYRAVLWVHIDDGRALPARIESPLVFGEERLRRGMGTIPERRTVFFEDYRPASGRLVPWRIRFEDGLNPSELVLSELELNPQVAGGLFQR